MDSVNQIYSVLATPAATLIAALMTFGLLIFRGAHRDSDGHISRRRLGSVFVLSATAYIFLVLVTGELLFGISVGSLISEGFGSERTAWLLLGLLADLSFRLWDEFRR